ncbi:MAG: hypothetical protein ABI633_01340 [Burkholderiales bacterium]
MNASVAAGAPNPFPGLRPFREEEEHLFFGRETQVDTMVDKLAATRFLAVVGTSGSGKSSLVNCGLVPALHRGLMAAAGSVWRVATLRPGNRPISALAQALTVALAPPVPPGFVPADAAAFSPAELMEATLRMGRLGLVDAVEQAHLDARQNLLVVIDQFEELFRYQALASPSGVGVGNGGEDATAFVNLLLEAGAQRAQRVYLVLTMRSDFLGDCAQFFGLPEAINRGQYLVPRLARDERRLAISGPLSVRDVTIDPVLLTRLVNDVGDNPDQLSILQHALNRTWAHWQDAGGAGPLSLAHYEAIGTMAHALNQHADEAWAALGSERMQVVCAALFKAITDKSSDARGTRRPTRLDALVAITGASAAELTAVIDVFRDPARSFLMPPAGVALTGDTPIDISHESLMRVWDRLRGWGDEEAQAAQTYRRLAETAELERAGRAALLRQPDLQLPLDWRERERPNLAWAERYRSGFEGAMAFLDRSREAFDEEVRAEAARQAERAQLVDDKLRTQRRWKVVVPILTLLILLVATSLWLAVNAYQARTAAVEQRKIAVDQSRIADELRVKAEAAAASAVAEAKAAREAQQRAEYAEAATRRVEGAKQEQTRLYAEATRNAPEVRSKIEQAVERQSLVYLQFADPAQRAPIERLRAALSKQGYSAPGAEKVGVAPSRAAVRYFREGDGDEARKLAALLVRWNWGPFEAQIVKGYEATSQLRQFEVWLARTDGAELTRLLQQINAATPQERKAAGQALQDRYTASPQAIAEALALFKAERIDALSSDGRLNALFFLSRTAPLAWDTALIATGRELIAFVRSRDNAGAQTKAELLRLERLLDAAKAGEAAPPAANLGGN